MPDMERLIDQLKVDMAKAGIKPKGKSADYWDGYRNGKSRARFEILFLFSVVCIGIASIGHFYT